jgi:hypothetical protein
MPATWSYSAGRSIECLHQYGHDSVRGGPAPDRNTRSSSRVLNEDLGQFASIVGFDYHVSILQSRDRIDIAERSTRMRLRSNLSFFFLEFHITLHLIIRNCRWSSYASLRVAPVVGISCSRVVGGGEKGGQFGG